MKNYLVIMTIILAGCPPPVTPQPEYVDADVCVRACEHGKKLGCEFAEPTPNGVECSQVCIETELTGWSNWNPECVLKAASCEAADKC